MNIDCRPGSRAVVVVATAALAFILAAPAAGVSQAYRYLDTSCCQLKGSRATLLSPTLSETQVFSGDFFVTSAYADSGVDDLIQTGVTYEFNASQGPSCNLGLYSRALYYFTEVIHNAVATCYNHGSASFSTSFLASVVRNDDGYWRSYKNGVPTTSARSGTTAVATHASSRHSLKSGGGLPAVAGSRSMQAPAIRRGSDFRTERGLRSNRLSRLTSGVDGRAVGRSRAAFGRSRFQRSEGAMPRLLTLALCVGLGIAAVASVAVSGTEPSIDGQPIRYGVGVGAVPPFAGSPSAGVAEFVRRFPTVENVTVRRSETASEAGGHVASVRLAVRSFASQDVIRAWWEAHVLVGALADTYVASGLPRLTELDATLVRPDGANERLGGGLGNVAPSQRFETIGRQLRDAVQANARGAGITGVRLTTVRGIDEALVIAGTVADPGRDVARLREAGSSALTRLLDRPPGRLEGVYLEVQDRNGRPVYVEATASRAGAAIAWGDRSLGIRVGRWAERTE